MSEHIPGMAYRSSPNLLERQNDRLCSQIISRLPIEQSQRLILNLVSMRAKKVITPANQRNSLKKHFKAETIEKLVENVTTVLDSTEGEFQLGNKVLEIAPFQAAVDRGFRALQTDNPDQLAAFDYWIKNLYKLPEDLPVKEALRKTITSPIARVCGELGFMWNLLKIKGGMALQGSSGLSEQVGRFLIQSSIDSSVKTQVRRDIQSLAEVSDESRRGKLRDGVLRRYGYEKESLEAKVFSHPDFFPRLIKSGIYAVTWYGGLRQFLGWSAFAAMVKVPVPFTDVKLQIPGSVERFRSVVDQYGFSTSALIAGGALAGVMAARMGIDYYVLKQCDMTPDTLELSLALSAGKIDECQNLRANPKFGLIGAPIDVAMSSTLYGFAWGLDLPYSIPAYLLAMGVDQISFMSSNLGYALISRRKGSKNSK